MLVLIDTAGCSMEEEEEEGGESRANPGEARAALAHVRRLLAAGVRAADVGVITPYNAQVRAAVTLTLEVRVRASVFAGFLFYIVNFPRWGMSAYEAHCCLVIHLTFTICFLSSSQQLPASV